MGPEGIDSNTLAKQLGISTDVLYLILEKRVSVSPAMAIKLSKALGRTPESWLKMQNNYTLSLEDNHEN